MKEKNQAYMNLFFNRSNPPNPTRLLERLQNDVSKLGLVFNSWPQINDSLNHMKDLDPVKDEYFYLHWASKAVEWTTYMIWNQVYRSEVAAKSKKPENAADEMLKRFSKTYL